MRHVVEVLVGSDAFDEVLVFCREHDVWPDRDLSPPSMSPISAFAKLDVPELPTVAALAEWLFLPVERLEYIADVTGRYERHADKAVNNYNYILQPKKSGGLRLIEAPKSHLKTAQRQILHGILEKVQVHGNAFGFVKGRNCITAASRHVGEDCVLRFDLKDFFPSIGAGRVFGLFRCLGFPRDVALRLTAICATTTPLRIVDRVPLAIAQTYRKPHLPQGSPASPSLANLAAYRLDRRLSGLAKRLSANYSRYADDLSFSGDHSVVGTLIKAVPAIVEDEGFHVNPEKTLIMSRTSRQIVTGMIVNDHINIDRREFDHLKAIIHTCGKSGDTRLDDIAFRNSLWGKISWVEAVNRNRGEKLWSLLSDALDRRKSKSSVSGSQALRDA